jgi:AraC-like DNA-binding protein
MDCLLLTVPPLPQLITVGHSLWKAGSQHFRRNFQVYDMLLVLQGTLFMTEDDVPYEIEAGQWLALEPGRTHFGHRPCEEDTEIYWVHYSHPIPAQRVASEMVHWTALLQAGTDQDEQPAERMLVIPKRGALDVNPLIPVLQEMVELHRKPLVQNAFLELALSIRFLALLQQAVIGSSKPTGSRIISDRAVAYLESRKFEPFRASELEDALHFDFDYITRCLKRHIGLTPLQYSLHLKLEEAKRRLAHSDEPVPAIAETVGFADYNYFIRVFRSKLGLTPGAYRLSHRGFM